MTHVSLSHLTKHYPGRDGQPAPTRLTAVQDLSLEIPDGKLTALLGPSGCGKTTILKLIAGLIPPTSGDIRFDGRSVLPVPAEQRGAVMVFQNHLLFPYLSVGENVAFGLKMRGEDRRTIARKVAAMLARVQLSGCENRKPAQLSGGQQQRVALARALVVEPRLLLLDEPLSNLDASLRDEMRELIRSLQREKGITTMVVTHDQEEAVLLADRLAVVFQGVLQQADAPRAFYEQPANLEVARFFGANNTIAGTAAGGGLVQTGLGDFRVQGQPLASGPVHLAIRPENIQILSEPPPGGNTLAGAVLSCAYTGLHSRLKVRVQDRVFDLVAEASAAGRYQEGQAVWLYLPPEKLWAFPDR